MKTHHGYCPIMPDGIIPANQVHEIKRPLKSVSWTEFHARATVYLTMNGFLFGWGRPEPLPSRDRCVQHGVILHPNHDIAGIYARKEAALNENQPGHVYLPDL